MTSTLGERALVLGGGGSAGHAWVIGVARPLAEAGVEVTGADLVIGTSSGATAAAQVVCPLRPTSSPPGIPRTAPQARTAPPHADRARTPTSSPVDHLERTSRVIAAAVDAVDMRRRMGASADWSWTPPPTGPDRGGGGDRPSSPDSLVRRGRTEWCRSRPVEARTGEPLLVDAHSGVDLVDALAARPPPS